MKIVFINHIDNVSQNTGITCVMTSVGRYHEVRLLDIVFNKHMFRSYLKEELLRESPDFICFSSDTFSFPDTLYWARFCKEICPSVPNIIGGVHPTIMPEDAISVPVADYFCIGEGEDAFVELLNKYQDDPEAPVAGIWHRNKQNKIIRTEKRPVIDPLDSQPFVDWDYWDMGRYLRYSGIFRGGIRVLASRGCPSDCAFCSAPAIRRALPGKYFRTRSCEQVAREMIYQYEKYSAAGGRYIHFEDSCFGADRMWFRSFAKILKEQDINIPWTCKQHPGMIDEEWAEIAAGTGCINVAIGIESADEGIRNNVLKKKVSTDDFNASIKKLRSSGVLYALYFILCTPGEKFRVLLKNLKMIWKLRPVKYYTSYFFPLPMTELADKIGSDMKISGTPGKYVKYFSRPAVSGVVKRAAGKLAAILVLINKLLYFIFAGFSAAGPGFIRDITVYFIRQRQLAFGHEHLFPDLYRNTVAEYKFLDSLDRFKVKGGAGVA